MKLFGRLGRNAWYFLGEGTLIVLSILLAFVANEWRVSARENAELTSAVANLRAEIEYNLNILEDVAPYHASVAEALGVRLAELKASDAPLAETPLELFAATDVLRGNWMGGVSRVESVTWDTVQDRAALARLDFETVKALSLAYKGLEAGVRAGVWAFADLLSDKGVYQPQDQIAYLTLMQLQFAELAARERTVIVYFRDALEKLDES